jgi:hypothetical protein
LHNRRLDLRHGSNFAFSEGLVLAHIGPREENAALPFLPSAGEVFSPPARRPRGEARGEAREGGLSSHGGDRVANRPPDHAEHPIQILSSVLKQVCFALATLIRAEAHFRVSFRPHAAEVGRGLMWWKLTSLALVEITLVILLWSQIRIETVAVKATSVAAAQAEASGFTTVGVVLMVVCACVLITPIWLAYRVVRHRNSASG